MSGDSTEKRALIYTTAQVKKVRLRTLSRENKQEENVEFDDQDLAFDKDLEKVGVVVRDLKRPMKKCVFWCWLTDEEKKWMKKRKDPVYEAKLLRKMGGLNFYDPDTNFTYTVCTEDMFWEARHGYAALGVKEGDRPEDPGLPFWLELLCKMIKETDE